MEDKIELKTPKNENPLMEYNANATPEERRERARIAGLASAEAKKEKKTLSEIVNAWANNKLKDKNKIEQLAELGISEPTNKANLLLSLLNNVDKGDTKSISMLIELLSEDRRREAEIRKLNAEIEKLQKEIAGEISENNITIINDIPKVSKDEQ